MMKLFFSILLLLVRFTLAAQFSIPDYRIARDSMTHITIFHSSNGERLKLSEKYSDTLFEIMPEIKIKNGIVDHKGLTGQMYVREYYVDSVMIGYLEFHGQYIERELYFNQNGYVFLEKLYDKGVLISSDASIRAFYIKK